ncbi:UNVERIFIED_CONTAM: hypothetical protein ABIC26_002897 [Paenibacillus sp. PvR008]
MISDTGKHRESYGFNRALEIVNEGTAHSTLNVTFNKNEGTLMFLDSHFKAVSTQVEKLIISSTRIRKIPSA